VTATRGPSRKVVDGELLHVSASQAKTFQSCARKWWYEAVMGLVSPSSKAQALGTRTHLELEKWYQDGKRPSVPSVVLALDSGELPERSDSILIEQELTDPELYAADVRFKGFIDLIIPGDHVRVIDWKTTSNLDYAKSGDELLEDFQMGAYGFYIRQKYPEAKSLSLAHVYLTTRGAPDFKVVEVEASWPARGPPSKTPCARCASSPAPRRPKR
jgi:CRISPR/Cas system-associated exonuclease Cas4 (RecB family)